MVTTPGLFAACCRLDSVQPTPRAVRDVFKYPTGRFYPGLAEGYYLCSASIRLDSHTSGTYVRLLVAVNGDTTNLAAGLATIEGNGGSTSQRTLTVTGTLKLTQDDYVSAFVNSYVGAYIYSPIVCVFLDIES